LPTATWAAKSAATRDCPRPPFLQCAQLAVGSRRIDTTVVERWRQLPDGQIEFTTRCRTTNLLRETFTLPLHAARLKARQILNDYPQNGRSRSSSNRSARSRGRCGTGASGSADISSTYFLCKDSGLEEPSNRTRTLLVERPLPTMVPALVVARGLRAYPSRLSLQRAPIAKSKISSAIASGKLAGTETGNAIKLPRNFAERARNVAVKT
jgi:hypothetical protein